MEMMTKIGERILTLKEELPAGVELVAVSKFHPVSALMDAYEAGQRKFGESRVQELLQKTGELPDDIEWHFIGHLQTNKVRQIIGKTSLIESIDSEKLIEFIDKESERAGVVTRVLMQVHVAREETKFGFYQDELIEYFQKRKFENLRSTHICGVMGMASNTDDCQRVREDFKQISHIFETIRQDESLGLRGFDILSMGMSGDWEIAVEEGSNLIRVGTRIFGEREY